MSAVHNPKYIKRKRADCLITVSNFIFLTHQNWEGVISLRCCASLLRRARIALALFSLFFPVGKSIILLIRQLLILRSQTPKARGLRQDIFLASQGAFPFQPMC